MHPRTICTFCAAVSLALGLAACGTQDITQDQVHALAFVDESGPSVTVDDATLASFFAGWTAEVTVDVSDGASEYSVNTESQTFTPQFDDFDIEVIGGEVYLVARGHIPNVADCYTVARQLSLTDAGHAGPLGEDGPFEAKGATHSCTSLLGCQGCRFVERGNTIAGCECTPGADNPDAWCQHKVSTGDGD